MFISKINHVTIIFILNNEFLAMNALKCQHGISMMEVLVSLIILSIGLLGLVQSQLRALRQEQYAYAGTVTAQSTQNAVEASIIRMSPG